MTQTVKKILNVVSTVIVVIVAVVVLALVAMHLMGLKGYVVLSGSMEPVYHTGSVIYVKSNVDADALEEGQIITFRLSGDTIATHRIIEVVEEDGAVRYRTKGDANEVADGSLVDPARVIGTPMFAIPYLGFALTYIQSAQGRFAAIAVGAFLLLIVFLPSLISEKGNDKKSNTKEEQT